MMIQEHITTAREFLDGSDREFAAGDALQGSEKLWGAFSHAVMAVCQERGWQYGSHREIVDASLRLAEEMGVDRGGVWAARSFHANLCHGFLEDFEIEHGRPVVRSFVERILGVQEAQDESTNRFPIL